MNRTNAAILSFRPLSERISGIIKQAKKANKNNIDGKLSMFTIFSDFLVGKSAEGGESFSPGLTFVNPPSKRAALAWTSGARVGFDSKFWEKVPKVGVEPTCP